MRLVLVVKLVAKITEFVAFVLILLNDAILPSKDILLVAPIMELNVFHISKLTHKIATL